MGDMYKFWRQLRRRGISARRVKTATTREFRQYFTNVSKNRYEEDLGMSKRAAKREQKT